jgi:tetratricopeptide (TPR) repeat protein
MSDETRSMLVRGSAAARVGEYQEAQKYLEWLFDLDPTDEEKVEAWYWLSKVTSDPAKKKDYLEQILAFDPFDSRARREFSILTGRLKADDIIDPEHIPDPASQNEMAASQRFTCPKCGGRMVYSPDGSSLVCEYCETRARQQKNTPGHAPEADDFLLSLATARGHSLPRPVHTLICQGCGAEFFTPPAVISLNCPFCGSTHVLAPAQTRERIEPGGVIPFEIDETAANELAQDWFDKKHLSLNAADFLFKGVYLPVWLFTMGGQLEWRCQVQEQDKWAGKTKCVEKNGVSFCGNEKILISGFRSDDSHLEKQLAEYHLDAIQTYNPGYLANWPAETYQVAMADASLDARQEALKIERDRIIASLPESWRNLSVSSARMAVDTYLLLLIPVWILSRRKETLQVEDDADAVFILNGQTGYMNGDVPRNGFLRFFLGD